MSPWIRVFVAILATYGAGLVGFLFVDNQIGAWYASLAKPPLTPPPSAFGVVWPILYTLMAASVALTWIKEPQTEPSEQWIRFYFIQLLFNAAWTMFFFGFHAILLAFVDLLFLIFIVITLIPSAWSQDRRSAYLLLPYLAWLLFAAYLNVGIWVVN